MQPPLMDESTVRINSCPAAGVQDFEIMDAIRESEDNDEEYLEIENAFPDAYCNYDFHCWEM
jgi:hypothetical protein